MHWFRLGNGERKNTTTPVRSKLKKRITECKKNNDFKITELGVNPAVSLITNNEQMDFFVTALEVRIRYMAKWVFCKDRYEWTVFQGPIFASIRTGESSIQSVVTLNYPGCPLCTQHCAGIGLNKIHCTEKSIKLNVLSIPTI